MKNNLMNIRLGLTQIYQCVPADKCSAGVTRAKIRGQWTPESSQSGIDLLIPSLDKACENNDALRWPRPSETQRGSSSLCYRLKGSFVGGRLSKKTAAGPGRNLSGRLRLSVDRRRVRWRCRQALRSNSWRFKWTTFAGAQIPLPRGRPGVKNRH